MSILKLLDSGETQDRGGHHGRYHLCHLFPGAPDLRKKLSFASSTWRPLHRPHSDYFYLRR
jgi:hypothetical protein